jgi:hypothetical protein
VGNKGSIERAVSGTVLELPVPAKPERDRKSGALVISI